MQNTLLLFEQFSENQTGFPNWFLVPEDLSRFDGYIINVHNEATALNDILYDEEGKFRYKPMTLTEAMSVLLSGEIPVRIVQSGFAP